MSPATEDGWVFLHRCRRSHLTQSNMRKLSDGATSGRRLPFQGNLLPAVCICVPTAGGSLLKMRLELQGNMEEGLIHQDESSANRLAEVVLWPTKCQLTFIRISHWYRLCAERKRVKGAPLWPFPDVFISRTTSNRKQGLFGQITCKFELHKPQERSFSNPYLLQRQPCLRTVGEIASGPRHNCDNWLEIGTSRFSAAAQKKPN